MARRKEFDPEAALDAAMRLFWRNGYEGTSTSDLVDGLGIARASLYGTFGSQRGLYLAALDRFLSGAAAPSPADILASRTSALDAVRDLLETSAAAPKPGTPQGCFVVNAMVEHGDSDPEISRRLEGNRSRLETALFGALLRARAQGRLAPGVDPSAAAAMLASNNSGLKVLSCAGEGQRDRIIATVDTVMAMLTSPAAAATD
ncbi:TetR/AcrR family transcriptional regulator [Streptomyces violaceusniger]|uniref:TetR/AcrR family transcriptional regulator n=1 Tax=Streptomyces violaceusniger TaxID=68280 RepID=UPI00342FA9DE